MTGQERAYLLSLCRMVREYQDGDFPPKEGIRMEFSITAVRMEGKSARVKYAIAYSLQKQGYIEVSARKLIRLSEKSIKLIRNRRKQNEKI